MLTRHSTRRIDAAVFAHNEAKTIVACIEALDRAGAARIMVILNGTRDKSDTRLLAVKPIHAVLEVYEIPVADKSNAINRYLYELRDPQAEAHVFVDGYAVVSRNALHDLADALQAHPRAHLAAGVPQGTSFEQEMRDALAHGRSSLHGNLFAMRPSFAARIVSEGIRLPRGLYRGDGLIGSMAKRDLARTGWDESRIECVLSATCHSVRLSPARLSDLRRQWHRQIRQAQGTIENVAIKEILARDGFAALPTENYTLIHGYVARHGLPNRSLTDRALARLAIRRLKRIGDTRPQLVFKLHPERAELTA
jgi:hypothetical protein